MIVTLEEAVQFAERERREGAVVVTTNGCFDILHSGHLWYLEEAARLGDYLIVGVNSDRSPYFHRKPGRPIVPEQERAALVAALKPVAHAFLYDDENPIPWLERIRPHFHVKGTDATYAREQCVEWDTVEQHGGRVVLLPKIPGKSTTNIIEKIYALQTTTRFKSVTREF